MVSWDAGRGFDYFGWFEGAGEEVNEDGEISLPENVLTDQDRERRGATSPGLRVHISR